MHVHRALANRHGWDFKRKKKKKRIGVRMKFGFELNITLNLDVDVASTEGHNVQARRISERWRV
jgi:hypothetical protein